MENCVCVSFLYKFTTGCINPKITNFVTPVNNMEFKKKICHGFKDRSIKTFKINNPSIF